MQVRDLIEELQRLDPNDEVKIGQYACPDCSKDVRENICPECEREFKKDEIRMDVSLVRRLTDKKRVSVVISS